VWWNPSVRRPRSPYYHGANSLAQWSWTSQWNSTVIQCPPFLVTSTSGLIDDLQIIRATDAHSLFQLITVILLPPHLRNLMNTLNCSGGGGGNGSCLDGGLSLVPSPSVCLALSPENRAKWLVSPRGRASANPDAHNRRGATLRDLKKSSRVSSSFRPQTIFPTPTFFTERPIAAALRRTRIPLFFPSLLSLWLSRQSTEFCNVPISPLRDCGREASGRERETGEEEGQRTNPRRSKCWTPASTSPSRFLCSFRGPSGATRRRSRPLTPHPSVFKRSRPRSHLHLSYS